MQSTACCVYSKTMTFFFFFFSAISGSCVCVYCVRCFYLSDFYSIIGDIIIFE